MIKLTRWLLLLLIFSGCRTGLKTTQMQEKATEILNDHQFRLRTLVTVCDSFSQKFPEDRLQLTYAYNSKSLIVFHRIPGEKISGGKEVFDNNQLGTTADEVSHICDAMEIRNIDVRRGAAFMLLRHLDQYGYSVYLVYSSGKISKGDYEYVQNLREKYYIVAERSE